LLDRAEQLLRNLVDRGGATDHVVLEHLLEVYQRERDWTHAIEIGTQIVRRGDREGRAALAHFHCELAEHARGQGDAIGARGRLKQARAHDRSCPRIGLLLADLELDAGHPERAREALEEVAKVAPSLAGETIEPYRRTCTAPADAAEFRRFLEQTLTASNDPRLAAALAECYQRTGEAVRAEQILVEQLGRHPSIAGLRSLVALGVEQAAPNRHAPAMLAFADDVLARRASYRCGNCGFAGKRLLWQCPGCRKWGRFAYVMDAN
jgi:lipopolysaccharide biosynthesis regulator YciM